MHGIRILLFLVGGLLAGFAIHMFTKTVEDAETTDDSTLRNASPDAAAGASTVIETPEQGAVTRGPVDLLGSLSLGEVAGVLDANEAELLLCYRTTLSTSPDLSGAATMNLIVGRNGSVGSAFLVGSTLGDQSLEECLTDVADEWRFPAATSGVTRLLIPYVFTAT